MNGLIVNNITLHPNASFEEAFSVALGKIRSYGIGTAGAKCRIYKKSVDARHRDAVKIVYSVLVSLDSEVLPNERMKADGITLCHPSEPEFVRGNMPLDGEIIVVGSGPAGMFCALALLENGYPVTLIEQGGNVQERKAAIERLKTLRVLDERTNIQFGAGGAGTFSDGKLVTRVGDVMTSYVMRRLVEFGAPSEIEYLARPHVGTDVLSEIVERVLARICELGGRVMFHTELTDFRSHNGRVFEIETDRGSLPCAGLVLAVGHSARALYAKLIQKGLAVEAKPFSIGMRIEHRAEDIDTALYGRMAGHPALGHAEYNLSYNTKQRGVYTFCMCPGGVVVPAASEQGGVVVNGMSYHSRAMDNSNSAVLCSVFKEDYGNTPMGAIELQRQIETAAFRSAGGDYSAPYVTVGDFLNSRFGSEYSRIAPSYMDGKGVTATDPEKFMPSFILKNLRDGIRSFDRRIQGFAASDAVLTGPETRTSAPLRILRDNDMRVALGYSNLYPCGEGAGYAGGITSAAIDGLRTAMAIIAKYDPDYHG